MNVSVNAAYSNFWMNKFSRCTRMENVSLISMIEDYVVEESIGVTISFGN